MENGNKHYLKTRGRRMEYFNTNIENFKLRKAEKGYKFSLFLN